MASTVGLTPRNPLGEEICLERVEVFGFLMLRRCASSLLVSPAFIPILPLRMREA